MGGERAYEAIHGRKVINLRKCDMAVNVSGSLHFKNFALLIKRCDDGMMGKRSVEEKNYHSLTNNTTDSRQSCVENA